MNKGSTGEVLATAAFSHHDGKENSTLKCYVGFKALRTDIAKKMTFVIMMHQYSPGE